MNDKEEELVAEMKKHQLEALEVSETKVQGNKVKQNGDKVCVYSGVQEGKSERRCGNYLVGEFWYLCEGVTVLMKELC